MYFNIITKLKITFLVFLFISDEKKKHLLQQIFAKRSYKLPINSLNKCLLYAPFIQKIYLDRNPSFIVEVLLGKMLRMKRSWGHSSRMLQESGVWRLKTVSANTLICKRELGPENVEKTFCARPS